MTKFRFLLFQSELEVWRGLFSLLDRSWGGEPIGEGYTLREALRGFAALCAL